MCVLIFTVSTAYVGGPTITGKNITPMTEMADLAIKVPSDQTNYIQEMHIAVGQLICGIVEEYFFKKN